MAEHAKLSASQAERWIHCPGSMHMMTMFPSSSSLAAMEGTLAHALAEAKLNDVTDLGNLRAMADDFYTMHPDMDGSFTEMVDYIDPYVDFVNSVLEETRDADSSAELFAEQRVYFAEYVPEGFGTADVVIVGDDCATIIDLKYGKGVRVSAKGNPQIRLYALGAVDAYSTIYDFARVRMVIYQPRLNNVTEEEMTVEELRKWAETEVKPAAKAALSENPKYCPGDWCTSHFCPGVAVCRARADYVLALERHSGKDPALLTDEEIADALIRIEALNSWARKLGDYALDEAVAGHGIPGWKIVEGKSNRVFADEDKVAEAAIKAGYDRALLYKSKLVGISDMEKLMGKKKFNEVLGKLVIKPKGAPKLAKESDPRPAFNPTEDLRNEFD